MHAVLEGGIPVLFTERFIRMPGGGQMPVTASKAEKLALGVYEVEMLSPSSLVSSEAPSLHKRTGAKLVLDGDVVKQVPVYAEMTDVEQAQAVNVERERRLAVGSSFPVPGLSDPVPLQGRPLDRTVYDSLALRALTLSLQGVSAPVIKFRDAADTIHMLSPAQFQDLIGQATAWFESVMAVSWAMKDATGNFPDGIPSDYTNDAHWP